MVSGTEKAGVRIRAFSSTWTCMCQHALGGASQMPRLSTAVLIHCFLNCLITLEETPYSADAPREDN